MANIKETGNLKSQEEWEYEEPNLEKGTGTPYTALFSETGEPLINPLTGIPLGVYITNFTFGSGDENEDVLRITINTGDPNTVDIPEIQEGKLIAVQWGYIYSNGSFKSSLVHLVEVKQVEVTFNDQGTNINLTAKDKVSNLRSLPPYRINGGIGSTFIDFMDDGLDSNIGIVIELFE